MIIIISEFFINLGISLLNYYCKKKVHFQNPAISIENQVNFFREYVIMHTF